MPLNPITYNFSNKIVTTPQGVRRARNTGPRMAKYNSLAMEIKRLPIGKSLAFEISEAKSLFGNNFHSSVRQALKKRGLEPKLGYKNNCVYISS